MSAQADLDVTESEWKTLPLQNAEVERLRELGLRLASSREWWGEELPEDRTVIRCEASGTGWRVRVSDAIGVIGLPTRQIEVRPKIPMTHLVFLLNQALADPRIQPQPIAVLPGDSLLELLARWLVRTVEELLRAGLLRDYEQLSSTERVARGQMEPFETGRLYYGGRLEFAVTYDEFTENTPFNRCLSGGLSCVVSNPTIFPVTRRAARRAVARFDDVGEFNLSDFDGAHLDRRTRRYATPLALARLLLRGHAVDPQSGEVRGHTFLLRTPDLVEQGVRTALARGLAPRHSVTKTGIVLSPTKMTLNPDLVFDQGAAVGDVKYRIFDLSWRRSDMYQAVAFATGFHADRAVVVGFSRSADCRPESVHVGDVLLAAAPWHACESVAPEAACSSVVDAVATFLGSSDPRGGRLPVGPSRSVDAAGDARPTTG